MNIVTFGEVLWDVMQCEEHIGGAPLNFAAHAAVHGADVWMVSAVGNDERGMCSLEQMKTWGIRTSYVSVSDTLPTGICIVSLDEHSIPTYDLKTAVAWDEIPIPCLNDDLYDVLYFGILSLRSQTNRKTLQSLLENTTFRTVFVDMNIRAPFCSEQAVRFALEHATVLKISDEEWKNVLSYAGFETDEALLTTLRAIGERYPSIEQILLTQGAHGALVYETRQDRVHTVEAVKTKAISTVGAGDSFCAAFLWRYDQSGDFDQSLQYAAKVAAFVVSETGAVPRYDPGEFV